VQGDGTDTQIQISELSVYYYYYALTVLLSGVSQRNINKLLCFFSLCNGLKTLSSTPYPLPPKYF